MPIYEYGCEQCHEDIEVIQKISDTPISICPTCNEDTLKKKTSMSAFHLKGGGWYKDGYCDVKQDSAGDSKNKESKKQNKESSDQSKKDTASGTTASEPANKTEKTSNAKEKSSAKKDTTPKSKAS